MMTPAVSESWPGMSQATLELELNLHWQATVTQIAESQVAVAVQTDRDRPLRVALLMPV